MITTIDGVEKNTGEAVWRIGYDHIRNYHALACCIYGDEIKDLASIHYYDSHELCKIQCDLMNKDNGR